MNNQFTYSSSSDPDIEELTSVFEELSQTFEYGHKLNDLALHNRRGIPSQLQSMQEKADRHALRDLPALLPILRELASDAGLTPPCENRRQRSSQWRRGRRKAFSSCVISCQCRGAEFSGH